MHLWFWLAWNFNFGKPASVYLKKIPTWIHWFNDLNSRMIGGPPQHFYLFQKNSTSSDGRQTMLCHSDCAPPLLLIPAMNNFLIMLWVLPIVVLWVDVFHKVLYTMLNCFILRKKAERNQICWCFGLQQSCHVVVWQKLGVLLLQTLTSQSKQD